MFKFTQYPCIIICHYCLPLILFVFGMHTLVADTVADSSAQHIVQQISDSAQRHGAAFYPYISYTPETRFAGGVAGIAYFRLDTIAHSRPSAISAGLIYSQLRQTGLGAYPDIYIDNQHYRIFGALEYFKFPDYFFGTGPATSNENREGNTPHGYSIILSGLMPISDTIIQGGFNAGLRLHVRHNIMDRSDSLNQSGKPGIIFANAIAGARGGMLCGIGFITNLDSRDNVFDARKGWYYEGYLMLYNKALGSDFSFLRLNADVRTYMEPIKGHGLALQAQFTAIQGTPPFYALGLLGGQYSMRGYFMGRYRDKLMGIIQAEYRLPLFWRLGLTCFTGIGDVAGSFGQFSLQSVKISAGLGLRFALSPAERLNIRCDLGFGRGDSQIYLGVSEAF
jgi:hypothetical protein